jgi:hypothetical protein
MISIAEVTRTEQVSTGIRFFAHITSLGNEEREIVYVSPFFGAGHSGFVALPSIGQKIVVVRPQDDEFFYYLGSFIEPPKDLTDSGDEFTEEKNDPVDNLDSQLYKARGVPQRTFLKDSKGNKIVLSDEYNSSYFNLKLQLQSFTGKLLGMIDSPLIASIFLKNDHGDGITITSEPNAVDAARQIKSIAHTTQEHIARHGRYLVVVNDGRELTLCNRSTGAYKESGSNRYGNVNLESYNKDINLYARSSKVGKIHIECTDSGADEQVVQIKTTANNSVVRISSNGKIEITTNGDLDINANQNININCGGSFSVNAGAAIQLKASSPINLDGSQIHLNSGLASPTAPQIGDTESDYEGVYAF